MNKEEIIAMMVALESYWRRDHRADWLEWERRVQTIRIRLSGVHGVETEMFVPEIHYRVPHVRIRWNETAPRLTVSAVIKTLWEGEPSIEVRPNTNEGLEMSVWLLGPGEAEVVATRVSRILGGRA